MTDRLDAALRELVDALRDELLVEVRAQASAPAPDRLLSVDEAARALGVGRSVTYDLIGRGQLRSIRIGRRRLIPAAAVAEYAARSVP